ncbi:hypothetical protein OFY43_004180 [Salmonella enterica]|nr:hypothetical protein [Salmonella enterica]EJC0002349.1 hypothetical protein [Salmonella enterica]EJC0356559.1 hypothetical protein [Salmonella enterica]EJC0484341.1 hypothetical protein [Salmonella enterica]EJC0656711.1 hypothetical protein [Salmonella enterica]
MESHSLTLDEACAFLKISNNRHCPITGEDSGMKIEYQDYGAVANIVITSTVFEFRKHNRVVDAALLCTPGIVASRNDRRSET